ncbi:hypothetical protein PI124_g13944 [Phytophthora idaei]|nr:hypothetical protein PI124_g13944 [Phytophthora idaei]
MAYFQHCAVYDDPDVFMKLSLADWQRLVELEAVMGSVADLALIEAQHSDQVPLELVVLLKYVADNLHSRNYWLCDLNALRTSTANTDSLPRIGVDITVLSSDDRTSLERIKVQVNKRLSNLTAEPVIIIIFDSRTKFSAGTLITPPQTATIESPKSGNVYNGKVDSLIEEGMRMLRDSHREVYAAEFAASSGVKSAALNSPPNLDFVPSIEDEVTICGAQVEMTPDNVSASMLHDQCSLSGTSSTNSGLT